MSFSDIAVEPPDERYMPAEFRTDTDHIQVIKTGLGTFMVRGRNRFYNSDEEKYHDWNGWDVKKIDLPLNRAMWEFSRMVTGLAAADEYRWSSATRSLRGDFRPA
jgi:hypothetical protein